MKPDYDMEKLDKFIKAVPYIVIIVLLLLYIDGCSKKKDQNREDTWTKLSDVSDRLATMIDDVSFAEESDDFDSMKEELGITALRCEEMKKIVDEVADKYADR